MHDRSDTVASYVLMRPADSSGALRMKPRAPFVGVLLFGSWGNLLLVPTSILLFSGEVPPRSLPVAVAVALVGCGLLYAAARSVFNRALLSVEQNELVFRFSLWPSRRRAWRLPDVRKVIIPTRSPSFMHPATYRGYPIPQPHRVVLQLDSAGGRPDAALPLTLGLEDAEAVVRFVARHR